MKLKETTLIVLSLGFALCADADGDPLVYTVLYSANGGETWMDVAFETPPSRELLNTVAGRVDGSYEGTGPRSVRFVVADSGTAIPIVSEIAAEHGLAVTEAERFVPEFDDVFVEIVSRA